MDKYAETPASIPSNARVYQLAPVALNGANFHGWKMVYFKREKTNKKDKNGDDIYQYVVDKAQPATVDSTTKQLKNSRINGSVLSKLMVQNAQQGAAIAKLTMMISKLKGSK